MKKYSLRPWKQTGISFSNWAFITWGRFNENASGIAVIIGLIMLFIAIFG